MPELGKATYRLDADKSAFDRALAEAKAEAAAFAASTDKELKKTKLGVDGLTTSFLGLGQAIQRNLSPGGVEALHGLGLALDNDAETAKRLRSELTTLRSVWEKMGQAVGDTTHYQRANAEIGKLDKAVNALQLRVARNQKMGFDTQEAQRDLTKLLAMQDRYFKQTELRTIQMDQNVARRFGIQSGGTRGGPLSRLLGYLSGNVASAQSPLGLTAQEQAVLAALPADVLGGSGGGGRIPISTAIGGGGGGNRGFNPMQLLFRPGNRRFLGPLGAFGGLSLGTMLGLGPEHILGVLASLGGSAAGGAAGGGMLAAGALGKWLVGGGSDMAVMKSTIADTQTLYKSYQNLQQAVAVYGKNSRQAAVAQQQLNFQLQALGPASKYEFALAKQVAALNTLWDTATVKARQQATNLLSQVVQLGTTYVPLVAQAAQRNLTIINESIKPLFTWLQGPQGISAWHVLEDQFAKGLPTAVHAFSQGLELAIKVVSDASQYTGGFMRHLDNFFTRWNSPSGFIGVRQVMDNLLYDFRIWKDFFKAAGTDLYRLFHAGVGEGNNLVVAFTHVLDKWGAWEKSVKGSTFLHTFFYNREQEVIALGHALSSIARVFGAFYVAVQPLVPVVTAIATAIGNVVNWVVDLGKHSSVIQDALVVPMGAFLLMWKMFGFNKATGFAQGAANAVLGTNFGKGAAASAASSAAAETAGTATAAEGGLAGGLLAGTLGKNLLGGGAGILAGSMLQQALGLRGGTAGTLGFGVAGGAIGSIFGPFGAAAGAAIGSTLGPSILHLLGGLFGRGAEYGKKFASDFIKPLNTLSPGSVGSHLQKVIADSANVLKRGYQPGSYVSGGRGGGFYSPGTSQSDLNKASYNLGWGMGQAVNQSIATAIQHGAQVTPDIIIHDFLPRIGQALHQGRPIAGAEAAKTMLTFAQELQDKGILPVGSVKRMITNIEQQFPVLKDAFKTLGDQTTKSLADSFRFTDAQKTLATTIQDISQQWAILGVSTKTDFRTMATNVVSEADYLRNAMRSKNSAIRQDAQQAWAALVSSTESYAKSMSQKALDQMSNMNKKGSGQFWNMAGSAISALKAIGDNTDQALRALGLNPPQWKWALSVSGALGKQMQQAAFAQAVGPGTYGYNSPSVHAGGGYIGQPGQKGRDQVPAVLGLGEAILNHDQQAWVNYALSRVGIGGLADLFKKTKGSLHYMAAGGFAGYSLPLPRSSMMPGSWSIDQGVDIPAGAGTPEFAIGPGRIIKEGISGFGPNAPVLQITSGPLAGAMIYYGHAGPDLVRVGQSVRAGQQISSVGSGIVGISTGPHIEIGFYPPGGRGGSTMAKTLDELLGGSRISGISGGGGLGSVWPGIKVGKVTGPGALPALVNAALRKVGNAANAYGNKLAGPIAPGGAGLSGPLVHIVQQLAAHLGWSGQVGDWLNVINRESGGSMTARNKTSGAYGIAQFINGPSEYAQYGGNTRTMGGQLLAMANYIKQRYATPASAWAHELSSGWYGPGGFAARVAGPSKPRNPRHHAPKRLKGLKTLSKLALGGDLNLSETWFNAIAGQNTMINQLGSWQSYLESLHQLVPLTTLITLADGSQVVNWGNPNGALGQLTGMIDPATGQPTKAIWDRLREIGSPGTLDKNTELGIDDQILGAYGIQRTDATNAWSYISQYNRPDLLAWLDNQLDPNRKGVELTNVPDWFKPIYNAARQYKNKLAQIAWLQKRKGELPAERAAREAAITRRFAIARHQATLLAANGKFNATQWLAQQRTALTNERDQTLAGIPTSPPASFLGDTSGWRLAQARERANVSVEFNNRMAALESTARVHAFEGQVARSNALFNLSLADASERAALTQTFDHISSNWTDIIAADRPYVSRDKQYITNVDKQLHSILDSGGLVSSLSDYVNSMGSLAINIDTLQNVDIQGLLNEINALQGTSLATSGGPSAQSTQLLDLQNQMLQQLSTALYVSQAQYGVLRGFATGTPYVEHTGPALIHEGEAIIPKELNPFSHSGRVPQVHIHGLGDFIDRVEAVVDGKRQDIFDYVNHDTAKHARTRRLLPGPIT